MRQRVGTFHSQRLVINADGQIARLDELVQREHRVVGLDDGLRHLAVVSHGRSIAASKHTFGEGRIENVASMRSGYSSRSFESISVPSPAPVPPPRECVTWKPCSMSTASACLRTTSCGQPYPVSMWDRGGQTTHQNAVHELRAFRVDWSCDLVIEHFTRRRATYILWPSCCPRRTRR